jgi:hypothetical protein
LVLSEFEEEYPQIGRGISWWDVAVEGRFVSIQWSESPSKWTYVEILDEDGLRALGRPW